MAGEDRQDPHALIEQLRERPWDFDFFQAVRLLECAAPRWPRLGQAVTTRQELVRFGQYLSLGFAGSALQELETSERAGHPIHRLLVRFFGLTGPNGALPLRVTEFIRNRCRGTLDADIEGTKGQGADPHNFASPKDNTLAAFLDIFHHRFLSLFYRAWAESRKTVDLDRPEGRRFSTRIGASFGLGSPAMRGRDCVPDDPKLAFAGHLSCQTRHAEGLRDIVQSYLGTRAQVESFVGHWLTLPDDSLCRVGESRRTGTLGQSVVVGRRMWDRQLKFRLRLGPMGFDDFQRFLPGGKSHSRLNSWVHLYNRREHSWDAQIVLKKEEVPATRLGQAGLLGWTTWVKSQPMAKDADNLVLPGEDVEL